jgi:hypothetical protein
MRELLYYLRQKTVRQQGRFEVPPQVDGIEFRSSLGLVTGLEQPSFLYVHGQSKGLKVDFNPRAISRADNAAAVLGMVDLFSR